MHCGYWIKPDLLYFEEIFWSCVLDVISVPLSILAQISFLQQLYKSRPSASAGKSFSVTAGGPTNRLMPGLFVILRFQSVGSGQVKMNYSFFFFYSFFSSFFLLFFTKIAFFGDHIKVLNTKERVVLSASQQALYMCGEGSSLSLPFSLSVYYVMFCL